MIKLTINGQEKNWDGDPDLSLLWFLRDEAGLTGTKFGCGQALCGSCTVIVDKQAVRAEAERLGLPVAAKPDSQDICFVASGHYEIGRAHV